MNATVACVLQRVNCWWEELVVSSQPQIVLATGMNELDRTQFCAIGAYLIDRASEHHLRRREVSQSELA